MSTYIDSKPCACGGEYTEPGHSWSEQAKRRLTWLYGEKRAEAIMADRDPKTQSDRSLWRGLGQRKAA